jgi:hypothetical protein
MKEPASSVTYQPSQLDVARFGARDEAEGSLRKGTGFEMERRSGEVEIGKEGGIDWQDDVEGGSRGKGARTSKLFRNASCQVATSDRS